MNYSDYITIITNELDLSAILTDPTSAEPTSNEDFNNAIPRSIDYIENRIQRALDLQNTYVIDTGPSTPSNRRVLYPTDKGTYVVVTQVSPLIAGIRQPPLLPMSLEALNSMYPSDTPLSPAPSIPIFWAVNNDGVSTIVGPAPDIAYTFEFVGTQRFDQLSSTNTSNFLTVSLPDIYLAGAMVFWAGWQRDYGNQADDPQLAVSWENQFTKLMTPALVETMRGRFQSAGWNARLPSPVASPPQT